MTNGGSYHLSTVRLPRETAAADPERRLNGGSAESALARVLAAKHFVQASAAELDEAILAARRTGCSDKAIGGVLGVTSEAIRHRRMRQEERDD